jgi:hypothetical protein
MPLTVTIYQNAEGAWPDIDPAQVVGGELISVACIHKGIDDGTPALALRLELNNGETAIVQTSLALMRGVIKAFAHHDSGDEAILDTNPLGGIPL